MDKVLIIKWGALGDVIIASPHIEVITAAHAGAQVHLLTAPAFAPLYAHHPGLRVRAVPRRGTRAMAHALHWVLRERFDVVYDLQGSGRSALLTAASRAGRRVALSRRYPYTIGSAEDNRDQHPFERLNGLLQAAGLPRASATPRLHVAPEEQTRVTHWLTEHGLGGARLVVLHAGASGRWPSKRWPREYFAELAQALERRAQRAVWVGAAEDAAINAALAARVGIDATSAFSVIELAELARRARFALVNDSGPMHVLATAGIPVYAFFGPTDPRKCHAVGQAGRVLTHAVACSPCYLAECPASRGHACMQGLVPSKVLARLETDGLL